MEFVIVRTQRCSFCCNVTMFDSQRSGTCRVTDWNLSGGKRRKEVVGSGSVFARAVRVV